MSMYLPCTIVQKIKPKSVWLVLGVTYYISHLKPANLPQGFVLPSFVHSTNNTLAPCRAFSLTTLSDTCPLLYQANLCVAMVVSVTFLIIWGIRENGGSIAVQSDYSGSFHHAFLPHFNQKGSVSLEVVVE